MRFTVRFPVALIAFALSLVFVVRSDADDGPTPPPFRGGLEMAESGTDLGSVDVFVRDAEGNPVVDLGITDFRLFEDGDPVEITGFTSAADRGNTAGDEAATNDDRAVHLVFYIDNRQLRSPDRNRLIRPLQHFIRSWRDHNARFMVVTHRHELEIVQPFTTDPNEAIEALRSLRLTDASVDERDREQEKIQADIRRADKNPHHTASAQKQVQSDIFSKINNFAKDEGFALVESLAAMRRMFTSLTGLPGSKHVIYVSNGLPMALAAELLHRYAGLGYSGSYGAHGSQAYSRNRANQYQVVAQAANSQNISIHTIDATGTATPRSQLGESDSRRRASAIMVDRKNRQAPLKLLSEETGGFTIVDTDDFSGELDRLRSALVAHYTLRYKPSSESTDTVHHMDVQLREGLDLATVFNRTLVNKSPETRFHDRVTSGLFADVDDNPLGISVTAAEPIAATTDRWQAVIEVQIPVPSLRMERDGDEYVAHAAHFVAIRNRDTGSTDTQRQQHTFRLATEDYDAHGDEHFPIYLRLLIQAGESRIVIGVRDETTGASAIRALEVETPRLPETETRPTPR